MRPYVRWLAVCAIATTMGCTHELRSVGRTLGFQACPLDSVPFSQLFDSVSEVPPWGDARVVIGLRTLGVVRVPLVTWHRPEGQIVSGRLGCQIEEPDDPEEPDLVKRYKRAWESGWVLPAAGAFERAALSQDEAYAVSVSHSFGVAPQRYYISWRHDRGVVAREQKSYCEDDTAAGFVFRYEGAALTREDWNRWRACINKMSFWTAPCDVDDIVFDGWGVLLAGRRGAESHTIERTCPTDKSAEPSSRVLAECIRILEDIAP